MDKKEFSYKKVFIIVVALTVLFVLGISFTTSAVEDAIVLGSKQFKTIEKEHRDNVVVEFENGDTITEEEIQLEMTMANVALEENKRAISSMNLPKEQEQTLIAELTPISYEEAMELLIKQTIEYQTVQKLGLAPSVEEAKNEFLHTYELLKNLSMNGSEEEQASARIALDQIEKFKRNAELSEQEYVARGAEVYQNQMASERLQEYFAKTLPDFETMTAEEFSKKYDLYVDELGQKIHFEILE